MWREYLDYTAAACAVINALLALIIAVLPVRRSVQKLRLGVAALVIAVIAAGVTGYARYNQYTHTQQAEAERAEVKARLSALLQQGRTLLGQIKDERVELPSRAADEWAQTTENFLTARLGASTIPLFRRDMSQLYGEDIAVGVGRVAYFRAVRDRVANLEVIAAQFDEPQIIPAQPSTPAKQ